MFVVVDLDTKFSATLPLTEVHVPRFKAQDALAEGSGLASSGG